MVWNINIDGPAKKQLKKLSRDTQKRILDYLEYDIAPLDDPRVRGAALSGNFSGYWRYRVGDYRLICLIEDQRIIITVITIGHRKEVY